MQEVKESGKKMQETMDEIQKQNDKLNISVSRTSSPLRRSLIKTHESGKMTETEYEKPLL